jgi:hypothetical protein
LLFRHEEADDANEHEPVDDRDPEVGKARGGSPTAIITERFIAVSIHQGIVPPGSICADPLEK